MATLETKADIARLRSRWTEPEIVRINGFLATGRLGALGVSQFEIGGRLYLDLRGLRLTTPVRDQILTSLDFSYCIATSLGQLVHTRLDDCRFVESRLEDTNLWVEAHKCVFDGAKFHVLGNRFVECSFVHARMGERLVRNSKYSRCDFTGSDWRTAHALYHTFDHCIWNECRFGAGSFAWSRFTGMCPDATALGDTIMDDVINES